MVNNTKTYYIDGRKMVNIPAVDYWNSDDGWVSITGAGDPVALDDIRVLFNRVPWLYRGINLVAGSVKSMPFALVNTAGEQFDSSDNWQNKVGFLPNPEHLFWLLSASMMLYGRGYLFREMVYSRIKRLRYYATPDTQELYARDDDTQLIGIERRVGGVWMRHPLEEWAYFWNSDPNVTGRRPEGSPALAALGASGVLASTDIYALKYFNSGAIRAFLLSVPVETTTDEREKMKSWLKRIFQGIRTALGQYVVSDKVSTTQIGDGLEGLQNTELTKEKREDIATALGVPQSLLFSNASNFAVAEQDNEHFYTKTVIPLCGAIARHFTEQVFEPLGLRLEFQHEKLSMFQEDEEKRSRSLFELMQAIGAATTWEQLQFGLSVLGFDVTEDERQLLEAHFAAKEERREEMSERLSARPQTQLPQGQQPQLPPGQPQNEPPQNARALDLDRWRRKSQKALKGGKSADVPFESDDIEPALAGAISAMLELAETPEAVDAAFESVWVGYP
jgi:phage portal protein BeeE